MNEWVDDMICQDEMSVGCPSDYPNVVSVVTRSKSKNLLESPNMTEGQLIKKKIHGLIRRVLLSKIGQQVGSIYTYYQPKFDYMLMARKDFDKMVQCPNISFEKLLRLTSYGIF